MRCSRLTAPRPEQGDRSPRRDLQASAEGFTEGHTAAQFSERRCSATFRAIPSTLERIDTAPHISRHLPVAATTYHLSVSRHLTATVSVRGIQLPMSDWQTACADDDIRAVRRERFPGAGQHEALRAFTPVFAGYGEMCDADPGPYQRPPSRRSRISSAPLRAAPHPGHAGLELMPRGRTRRKSAVSPKRRSCASRVAKQGGGGRLVLRDGRFAASSA